MRIAARPGLSMIALAIGLAVHGVARAQGDASVIGVLTGEVAHCVNGAEQPAAQVAVGVEGGSASLAHTDANGEFLLALPAGQYTVVATASDGTASRQYVPVEGGQALDIGILDIGGGVAGCGLDSDITAPVLPTLASTPVIPTPQPPAPTPVPAAQPAPAPTPDVSAPQPAMDAPADPAAPDPSMDPDPAAGE